MALDMTPEQREIGKANFGRVSEGLTRRDFMKSMALTGGIVAPISAAAYFQYASEQHPSLDKPVRAALIGAGDEGGVLAGEHNPKYLEIVAVCDIRPSNQKRIFTGEPTGPRRGLNFHYGRNANKDILVYTKIDEVLARSDIEAVIIALPLFLHHPIAIKAMQAGKHVLCEKLMAWNITQCKEMIQAAEKHDRILSIGHQRHYSLLYAHAVDVMHSGVLGDVRHIRALWHRNNARPKLDANGREVVPPAYRDSWKPDIKEEDRVALENDIKKYGYKSMEELVRWRLYNRTGAGLMAELGSHQLDACSIFLGKVHPLAVSGVGGRYFYRDEREVDDHVFVTFEFPGLNYFKEGSHEVKDKDDKVIVTYSSINTNQFEQYGECVMGSRGTMVVEKEENIQIYPEAGGRSLEVTVSTTGAGKPALEASSTSGGPSTPVAAAAAGASGPPSRGYREEIEHFAYCIRMWQQGMSKSDRPNVRCPGPNAMADAIIALTSNLAMGKQQRIEFKPEWFDPTNKAVPDAEMEPKIVTG
jgi:predicted dehydrogenase